MTATAASSAPTSSLEPPLTSARPASGGGFFSVIVPTYRRVDALRTCLTALAAQERPADEVLLAVRDTDVETRAFLEEWRAGLGGTSLPQARVVTVTAGGVIAAMQMCLDAADSRAAVVCLTDDDSAPRPDWLRRIEDLFQRFPRAVGVGGRDMLPWDYTEREREEVGVLRWYGKMIGFHHKGVGQVRPVDLLKGVNCAFRAAPLRRVGFDARLKGTGAQVHWEMGLCLRLQAESGAGDSRGPLDAAALLYDPALLVDHYPAPRLDDDLNHRGIFHAATLGDAIYNETLILLEALSPARRVGFWLWTQLVGTRFSPGLAQFVRFILARDRNAATRLAVAYAARTEALRDHKKYAALARDPRRAETADAVVLCGEASER